jgi:hypothetical protein
MRNKTLLYINDTLVDPPEGFNFATTVKRLEIGDITGRSVSFTNTLKLPWSSANQKLFGFIWNEKTGATVQYSKLPAKLIQNGVEIIPDAICWVVGVDGSGVSIGIYDNSTAVFAVISGKKLNRLSHIADSAWNAADMDSARTSTSGKIAAILDWGRNGGGTIFNATYFLPSFFYNDFVKQILQQTGLTLSGAVLTDQTLLDLVVPYGLPKFEYPSTVNQDYIFRIRTSGLNVFNIAADAGSPSSQQVRLDYDIQDPPNTYQGGARIFNTSTYIGTVPNTGASNAWLRGFLGGGAYMTISVWNPGDVIQFLIRIRDKNGVLRSSIQLLADYATYGAAPVVGLQLAFPTTEVALYDGDQIDMVVETLVGSGSGAMVMRTLATAGANETAIVFATISGNVSLSSVRWQLLLPDVLQSEILKDFFVRFGIIHNQKGGTLYLKSIKEITEDTQNAVVWTEKRTADPDQINYSPSSYGQSNVFDYSEDSGAGIEPDANAGAGSIMTNNKVLTGEKTVFQTFFEACQDATVHSVLAALVRVFDSTSTAISDFEKEPGLRLLTLRAKTGAEPNITFNAIARSDYKIANFLYPTGTKDMSWNYFLNRYYGPVFLKSMQNLRIVTRKYNLTELDVAGFDPHKMIYDDGSYFLVSQIKNFIPGFPTQVELLKIG